MTFVFILDSAIVCKSGVCGDLSRTFGPGGDILWWLGGETLRSSEAEKGFVLGIGGWLYRCVESGHLNSPLERFGVIGFRFLLKTRVLPGLGLAGNMLLSTELPSKDVEFPNPGRGTLLGKGGAISSLFSCENGGLCSLGMSGLSLDDERRSSMLLARTNLPFFAPLPGDSCSSFLGV